MELRRVEREKSATKEAMEVLHEVRDPGHSVVLSNVPSAISIPAIFTGLICFLRAHGHWCSRH